MNPLREAWEHRQSLLLAKKMRAVVETTFNARHNFADVLTVEENETLKAIELSLTKLARKREV